MGRHEKITHKLNMIRDKKGEPPEQRSEYFKEIELASVLIGKEDWKALEVSGEAHLPSVEIELPRKLSELTVERENKNDITYLNFKALPETKLRDKKELILLLSYDDECDVEDYRRIGSFQEGHNKVSVFVMEE